MVNIEIVGKGNAFVIRMIDEADVFLGKKVAGTVPGIVAPQYGEIEIAGQQLLIKVTAVTGGNVQANAGIILMIGGQYIRQTILSEVHGEAAPKCAADFSLHGLQVAMELFNFCLCGLAVAEDLFSGRCEANALAGTQQKFGAQLFLQRLDPLGEGRLGHIKLFGSMGDIPAFFQNPQQLIILLVHE